MHKTMNDQILNVAIIGMGGFAADHHRAIHALEQQGQCRLLCTCDPNPDAFLQQQEEWGFAQRGVRVYADHLQMLDAHKNDLNLVTIPTPIPLHAAMHRAVIENDLACYLEKPPSLNINELKEMLEVETTARWLTNVGFNFIIEAERQHMKERILAGEFGTLKCVSFLGITPRATSYFQRSPWAGRIKLNGTLVLDSVIGNANSHYLHNLLFWAGNEDILSWANVANVEAELYRAHAIENYDSFFARGVCTNGVEVRVATTHACDNGHDFEETLECEQATIRHKTNQPYFITYADGNQETVQTEYTDLLQANLHHYLRYVRGKETRPINRLSDTRPFVEFFDLAYIASNTITPVGGEQVTRSLAPNDRGEYVAIHGIRDACYRLINEGLLPSQQGLSWALPGGTASIAQLGQFNDVIARLYSEI